ncbi:hypothetical protein DK254_08340 [Pseudomonas sp. RW407]|uniref:hypothetical protein n=1 Tax=Pseudomonas sp. RW407 TaxID=2202894 RepID=UPI000D6F2802|nr:hypothetical protein [Pseudomonas sp. RW407]PWU30121.1 hypothetical protein DK254_08340 [Pseudomonas sp. RW407]
MAELICRKTMMHCQTPGMCSPHGGRPAELAIPDDQVLVPRSVLQQLYDAVIDADEEGLAGHAEPMVIAAALLQR